MMRAAALAATLLAGPALAERQTANVSEDLGEEGLVGINFHSDGHMESHRAGAGGFVCCVKGLEVNAELQPENLVEAALDDKSQLKTCILTAWPPSCQHNGNKCKAECQQIIRDSVQFHEMRQAKIISDVNKVVTDCGKDDAKAEAAKTKKLQQLQTEHTKELKRIESAYKKAVDPKQTELKNAEKAQAAADAAVKKLEDQLKAAKEKASGLASATKIAQSTLSQAKTQADKDKGDATTAAEKKKTDDTTAAEKVLSDVKAASVKTIKEWQDKKNLVDKQVQEVVASTKEVQQKVTANVAPCAKSGKIEDCCCSLVAKVQDVATAMRVDAATFTNWDQCFGAFPYSATAFLGSSCNYFGHCGKCEDKICLNEHGGKGSCPHE